MVQCPKEEMEKSLEEMKFEPIGFLSGSFRNSLENWFVSENEGFAIEESMTLLDYITTGRLIHIFTDHVNLLSIKDPQVVSDSIPRYAVNKLMRWAIRMSAFRYIFEYIPGELNYWVDMLSRWASCEYAKLDATRVEAKSILLAPIIPSFADEYEWPTTRELESIQPKKRPRNGWVRSKGLLANEKG